MDQSPEIKDLCAALADLQGEITSAIKDRKNDFFKSRYATLTAVYEVSKTLQKKHGIAVIQLPGAFHTIDGKPCMELHTRITHKTGQWLEQVFDVPLVKTEPQGVGSATTYARRYAHCAALGIDSDDDDGNAASSPHESPRAPSHEAPAPKLTPDQEIAAFDLKNGIAKAASAKELEEYAHQVIAKQAAGVRDVVRPIFAARLKALT